MDGQGVLRRRCCNGYAALVLHLDLGCCANGLVCDLQCVCWPSCHHGDIAWGETLASLLGPQPAGMLGSMSNTSGLGTGCAMKTGPLEVWQLQGSQHIGDFGHGVCRALHIRQQVWICACLVHNMITYRPWTLCFGHWLVGMQVRMTLRLQPLNAFLLCSFTVCRVIPHVAVSQTLRSAHLQGYRQCSDRAGVWPLTSWSQRHVVGSDAMHCMLLKMFVASLLCLQASSEKAGVLMHRPVGRLLQHIIDD